jgi:uncharacterized membrane protein
MPSQNNSGSDKGQQSRFLMRYAGLAMQFLVSIGLAVFIGLKLDKWLKISIPVLAWLLPLVVIVSIIYKIAKDTGKK